MSQETIQIKQRVLGQNLNALRHKGIIPGIMYGQSLKESLPIEIQVRDLQTIIDNRSNTTTFPLTYNGEEHMCILREYQTDRLHTHFLHVDFQYVKENETINMQIPMAYEDVEFLSAKKLILEKAIAKLPVFGPVQNLPKSFTINVGNLTKGSKILAGDIALPPDTELLLNPETIVAIIQ